MTLYLVDLNVLQELHPHGNKNVRVWLESVDDDRFRVSAITFLEKREGLERERKRRLTKKQDASDVDAALQAVEQFEILYADRVLPVDVRVVREWARLKGAKGKNDRDVALAATARVHDLVVVTRNVDDFDGRGVRVLNPFAKQPKIVDHGADDW